MRIINESEMKSINGGGTLTGTVLSAFVKGFSVISDMGKYVGSAIRRLIENSNCSL